MQSLVLLLYSDICIICGFFPFLKFEKFCDITLENPIPKVIQGVILEFLKFDEWFQSVCHSTNLYETKVKKYAVKGPSNEIFF